MREKILLQRLVHHSAVILRDGEDGVESFAAYAYGDRRRRPLAFIALRTLQQYLADGIVHEKNERFFIAESAAKRYLSRDTETAHARQHQDLETIETTDAYGRFRAARVNMRTRSPLLFLSRRKDRDGNAFLTAGEIEAAAQLTRDYARSALSPSVTQKYDNVGGHAGAPAKGPEDISIRAIDARKRYLEAMDYMGAELGRVVSHLCCEGRTVAAIGEDSGYPRASVETLLKVGLGRLANFYGTNAGEYHPAKTRAASP